MPLAPPKGTPMTLTPRSTSATAHCLHTTSRSNDLPTNSHSPLKSLRLRPLRIRPSSNVA
eukprot:3840790-Lingulodinium_polyedra.AAC.1